MMTLVAAGTMAVPPATPLRLIMPTSHPTRLAVIACCAAFLLPSLLSADPPPLESQLSFDLRATVEEQGKRTYQSGGIDFDISIDAIFIVLGNFSLLTPGEPVPSWRPEATQEDPLSLSAFSQPGYRVAELIQGHSIDYVVPTVDHLSLGPLYGIITNAAPFMGDVSGQEQVPELAQNMMIIRGRIVAKNLVDKGFVIKHRGQHLLSAAAPSIATTTSKISLAFDFQNLLDGVALHQLSHTTNVIIIDATTNAAAYEVIAPRLDRALSQPAEHR